MAARGVSFLLGVALTGCCAPVGSPMSMYILAVLTGLRELRKRVHAGCGGACI